MLLEVIHCLDNSNDKDEKHYSHVDVPDTGGLATGFYLPGKDTGQLELHGKVRLRTWTKLAKTAYAGQMYFITAEKVDFAPGEQLILPGTEIPSNIFSPDGFGIDQVCNL